MNRREFAALGTMSLVGIGGSWFRSRPALELAADVAIIGGGVGGCAAALAVCRQGLRAILVEPTDWIGGQLTSQGVPPDEHPWIEKFGCTASYRDFRQAVRAYYREHYPLTAAAAETVNLNPGAGWVSRICCEPRVCLAVLEAMLAPYVAKGLLRILREQEPVAAEVDHDRVKAVEITEAHSRRRTVLRAAYFVDATELGDLLPLTRTEHVIGAESRTDTGEPNALTGADPLDQQAITWCFALEHRPGENHVIARPEEYSYWRDYVPAMTPPWPGKLLAWETAEPATLRPRGLGFDPVNEATPKNLWTYRRVRAAKWFRDPAQWPDLCVVNWPQNDYLLGPLVGVSAKTAARHLKRSRQVSLSLLYWMQTEAPRPDGGTGWKGLRLAKEVLDGPDGLAKAAYIREARRIRAEFTITENHVGGAARKDRATGNTPPQAEVFPDSVGIGAYRIDLHPSTTRRNYLDIQSLPFQIPLGALIPRRLENLLPASKNIGTTHITNGCYRLHPVEWNIGEAVGELSAYCFKEKRQPRQVRNTPKLLAEFQEHLRRTGFELEWPAEVHPL
ncbi:MAG TPA: FAD-dependent oxidoreductase [Candidatus Limnocylindria bacterium]|nr:FAD-dependent oxidoreductase [Candidatus Limnocylindria bacterium]